MNDLKISEGSKETEFVKTLEKKDYNHTEANDPYFSSEQASKRGPERHPTGYNFLGPNTEFEARMLGSDFYKNMMLNAGRALVGTEPYDKPINELDKCAMEHDAIFSKNNNTEKTIRDADIKFRECTDKITDANLKYYIQIQLAKGAIGLKEFAEDIGVIKPELFAYINHSIEDVNQTLAKNHTIPSTKEEQQQEDKNFYVASLMMFFRVGVDLIIPIGTRLTTEQLIKFVKSLDIDLITYVRPSLRPFFERIVNNLMGRRDISEIVSNIVDLGETQLATFIRGLFKDSDIFGTGISGYILKLGYTKFVKLLIDNYLTRFSTQWGSNSWRKREIMTQDELEQIIQGDDPAIFKADTQRDTFISRLIGFSVRNPRIIEITNLFKDIENLTNRERIMRFGNFNRAIIRIRDKRPNSILTLIYLVLTGTNKAEFVGDITIEQLKNLLNNKLSNNDISQLLNREGLIVKLSEIVPVTYLRDMRITREVLQNLTYMQFIDLILRATQFTQNSLKDLLS